MPLMKNNVNLTQNIDEGLNRLMSIIILYLPVWIILSNLEKDNYMVYIFPLIFLIRDFLLRIMYVTESANIIVPTIVIASTIIVIGIAKTIPLGTYSIFGVYSLIMVIQSIILLGYVRKNLISCRPRWTNNLLDFGGLNNWVLNAGKNVFIMLALDGLEPMLRPGRIVYWINLLSPVKQIVPLSINIFGHKQLTTSLWRRLLTIFGICGALSIGLLLINYPFIQGVALTLFDLSMIVIYFLVFKYSRKYLNIRVSQFSVLITGVSYLLFRIEGIMTFNHLIITLVILLTFPLILSSTNEGR